MHGYPGSRFARLALLCAAVLLAACSEASSPDEGASALVGNGATEATGTAVVTPRAGETAYGVAGLIPAGWPTPTDAQWRAFYDSLDETGGWLGVYGGWRDGDAAPGEVPRLFDQFQVGEQVGFDVLALVGWASDQPGQGLRLTVDWTDPAQVEAFTRTVVALAERERPRYLGVGNEVNRVWEADRAAFDAFATALPAIADAIRAASPDTRVFVVFQYEQLLGEAFLVGGSGQRSSQFDLVDRIAPAVDLVALTTYPFFDYETPEAIPDDYYARAADRIGKPVAFTEIGWPSAPFAPRPDLAHGGTPEEQAAFVERLASLLAPAEPEFALYFSAHDVPDTLGEVFVSLGLRDAAGTPKPALEAWRTLTGR